MNIIILTQPLHLNYGGILQAYALQHVVKELGHNVWTEDRKPNNNLSIHNILLWSYQWLKNILRIEYKPTNEELNIISQNIKLFINKYISTTEPIYSSSKEQFKKYSPNGYIVGSDQVWRPKFSYDIYNYFLDFTKNDNVKRIAYAASFGVSNWEFTRKETKRCAALIKQFDAVSTREEDGVKLCKEFLGVDAQWVLDPTLLLSDNDYFKLFASINYRKTESYLMTYILNETESNTKIVNKLSEYLGLNPRIILPKAKFANVGPQKINECILPSIESWLYSFYYADFVISDSFHGTVFSIIFRKQFFTIDNPNNGSSRLRSLLNRYGLLNRLVTSVDDISENLIKMKIDYDKVYEILNKDKKNSLEFLINSLK